MLALLLSWLHVAWLSLIFGIAGLRLSQLLLKEEKRTPAHWAPDYIILFGFLLITAFVGAASLVGPIQLEVELAFLAAGIAGTIRYASDLKTLFLSMRQHWSARAWGWKLAMLTAVGISALAAFIDIGESDTWFYHSQAILWIKEYGVVPGLGNIHGRFAFNSHFFVALALFAHYFSEEQVIFPLLSFFYMLFTIRLLTNMNNALARKDWFFLCTNTVLLALFSYQVINQISGTGTDEISMILLLYVFFLFLEVTAKGSESNYAHVVLWTVLLSAVTFKLSALFMAAMFAYLLPGMWKTRKLAFYTGLTALVLLPFIGRNILLSGYLVYPVPAIDVLDVDWKIPLKDVIQEKELVEGWAKQPEGMTSTIGFEEIPLILQLPFNEWLRIWWPAQSMRWKAIMILSLLTIIPFFRSLFRKDYAMFTLYGVLLLNLAFWFLEAPEPRFAYAFLFLGSALMLSELAQPVLRLLKPGTLIFPIVAVLLVALVVFRKDMRYFPHWESSYLWCPRYPIHIETKPYQAIGFTLQMPGEKLPAKNYFCHDAPLPCTPFPKPDLALRGASFKDGFHIRPINRNTHSSHNTTK